MIKFTYDEYQPPKIEGWQEVESREPKDYAVPDQILQSIRNVLPLAEYHVDSYHRDLQRGDTRKMEQQANAHLPWDETLQITTAVLSRFHRPFAEIFQAAVDSGRVMATKVYEGGLRAACGYENDNLTLEIDIAYEENIGDVTAMVHEAGHLVGRQRSNKREYLRSNPDVPNAKVVDLAEEVQSQFFGEILGDPRNVPTEYAHLNDALAFDKRRQTASVSSGAIENFAALDVSTGMMNIGTARIASTLLMRIHNDSYTPGLLLSSGLYAAYSDMLGREKRDLLDVVFPGPGKHQETLGTPPLELLLSVVGVKDQNSLNAFFKESANRVYSEHIRPVTVMPGLGLSLPTAADILRYGTG